MGENKYLADGKRKCDRDGSLCDHLSMYDKDLKFSLPKLFVGLAKIITSKEFIAFGFFAWFVAYCKIAKLSNGDTHLMIIGLIIVTCIFILKTTIEKVLEILANRTNIDVKANLNAGLKNPGIREQN